MFIKHIKKIFSRFFITDRAKRIENIQIDTPVTKLIHKHISYIIKTRENGGEASGLIVYGPSGSGKTTAIRTFIERYKAANSVGKNTKKLLYIDLPMSFTVKDLIFPLLRSINKPVSHSTAKYEASNMLINHVKNLNVSAIFINNFHISHPDRPREFRQVFDWMKIFCQTIKIPVVLICDESTLKIMNTDAQLRRFFTYSTSSHDISKRKMWER